MRIPILTLLPTLILLTMPAPGAFATSSAQETSPVLGALRVAECDQQNVAIRVDCERARQLFERGDYPAAAAAWEQVAARLAKVSETGASGALGEDMWSAQVDMRVLAAHAWEAGKDPGRAGMAYFKAAKLADNLAPYLMFKAAQNLVDAPTPPTDILGQIAASDALDRGFEGSTLVAAQVDALLGDGLPSAAALKAAFESPAREQACGWISGRLNASNARKDTADLQALTYGHCLPSEGGPKSGEAPKNSPSPLVRLARADRWFAAVRFPEALAELVLIPMDKLDPVARCRAEFRLGRTFFRLKKRTEALQRYEKVAARCTDPRNEDQRVRALYAAGDTLFWRSKFAESRRHFETLLKDYPERSHADDAILYLARIARKTKDGAREKQWVERALKEYPDGDMLHEIVWEYTEDAIRAGRHAEFLKVLAGLKMPAFDPHYYSQGRLGYFAGRAYARLGEKKDAYRAWQKTWATYPFSFYGYLSRERLIEAGQTPASMDAGGQMRSVDWFLDPAWQRSPGARATKLGLFKMAADLEQARQRRIDGAKSPLTDADRWRLSALEHLAGRFPVSHNIARRRIDGRPWAEPAKGRLVRWSVAWPNPFRSDILRAIVAERRQARAGVLVEPALPAAIMREESSFIEDIESYAGALGLMQLMPATAGDHDRDIPGGTNRENLKTSLINIRVGVDHLYTLAQRFDNQPVLIAAAYNAGAGAVNRWIRRTRSDDIALWVEDIPYDQTRNYTKRVIGSYAAYQWLRGIYDLDPTVLDNP